jgi:hypothetical protein
MADTILPPVELHQLSWVLTEQGSSCMKLDWLLHCWVE